MSSNISKIIDIESKYDVSQLSKVFCYNRRTGRLSKLTRGKMVVQKTKDNCGYLVTTYKGRIFRVHRIIWALVHGEWPKGLIDHINRVKIDNRLSNIRLVNHQLNSYNSVYKSKSGFTGVTERITQSGQKRYIARLSIKGKSITGGAWDTPEEAHASYLRLKAKYIPFDGTKEIPPFTREQQFSHMMQAGTFGSYYW